MHLEGKLFCTTGLLYQKAQLIDLVGSAAGSHNQMISVRKQLVPVPDGALLSKHVKGRERKKNRQRTLTLFSRLTPPFHFHYVTNLAFAECEMSVVPNKILAGFFLFMRKQDTKRTSKN